MVYIIIICLITLLTKLVKEYGLSTKTTLAHTFVRLQLSEALNYSHSGKSFVYAFLSQKITIAYCVC